MTARRLAVVIAVLIPALLGGCITVASAPSDPAPAMSASPSPVAAGQTLTVALSTPCTVPSSLPSGSYFALSVSLSSLTDYADATGMTYSAAPGQSLTTVMLPVPADLHAGQYDLAAYCFITSSPFSYRDLVVAVTGVTYPVLAPITVVPTSGPPGTAIDVSAPCAHAPGSASAFFSAALVSTTDPSSFVVESAYAPGPTIHVSLTVPTDFAPGAYLIETTCDDYVTVKRGADVAFTVTPTSGDRTPPSCTLSGMTDGSLPVLHITARDLGTGLAAIKATTDVNATISIPSFTKGTTDPVIVTATKVDPSLPSHVAFAITDVAGNGTSCDPIISQVMRGYANAVTLTNVPRGEDVVTVENGSPGLRSLTVDVNGTKFRIDLTDSSESSINVRAAMAKHDSSTITLTGHGAHGASATVLVWDGKGKLG